MPRGRRSKIDDAQLEVLLLEADATEHGVAVATDDPKGLRARLYPCMKNLGLTFLLRIPAVENELWLIKKS